MEQRFDPHPTEISGSQHPHSPLFTGVSLLLISATCPHAEAGYAKPQIPVAILNVFVKWLLKLFFFFNTSKNELLENWGIGSFKDLGLKCHVVVKGHGLNQGSQAHGAEILALRLAGPSACHSAVAFTKPC